MNWQRKIKQMIEKGDSPEACYNVLHEIINGNNPTFYRTIVQSEKWQEWEKEAYNQGIDWAEATECGWMSVDHWNKFVRFITNNIEKEIRSAWKYGDLREGNFENCINRIFDKNHKGKIRICFCLPQPCKKNHRKEIDKAYKKVHERKKG